MELSRRGELAPLPERGRFLVHGYLFLGQAFLYPVHLKTLDTLHQDTDAPSSWGSFTPQNHLVAPLHL